tara:strand:+ start:7873 stop:8094 length:222 start_codon:yes stop_codon:yes gene_type:complete
MIDKRNASIKSGELSIGPDGVFDEIEDSEEINLYVDSVDCLELIKGRETRLKLKVNASDFDRLAKEWCEMRKL